MLPDLCVGKLFQSNVTNMKEPTVAIAVKCKIKRGQFVSFEGQFEKSDYPALPVLMLCHVRVLQGSAGKSPGPALDTHDTAWLLAGIALLPRHTMKLHWTGQNAESSPVLREHKI